MENYIPIQEHPIYIKNSIDPLHLSYLHYSSLNTSNWHFKYGGNSHQGPHPKLEISEISKLKYLLGFSFSLLLQIFNKEGKKYFQPELLYCGISIKDKNRKDNIHCDYDTPQSEFYNQKVLKILGIINPEWKKEWGGGFIWNNKIYPLSSGDFIIFDPKIPHAASDILCNEKRIAIDFTVPAKT